MSTLAYAALTTKREEAPPTKSFRSAPPGVGGYLDALAALVPAEVLTVHATLLTFTMETGGERNSTYIITGAEPTLQYSFYGLIVLAALIYVIARLRAKNPKLDPEANKWNALDYLRTLIPPLAFVAWTMIQRATAFDAVVPSNKLGDIPRTAIAIFLAVLLGIAAVVLAYKADQHTTE